MLVLGLLCAGLAGCASSSTSGTSQSVNPQDVPAAVQAAFYSEHPYAQMDHPSKHKTWDDWTYYEIPYTRSDGTKGDATYAPTGEIQKDQ